MDEWNQDNPVFTRMGSLLFELQSLESALVNLFGLSVSLYDTRWVQPLRRLFSEPVGDETESQVGVLLKEFAIPESIPPKLLEALKIRQFVIHDFYFLYGHEVLADQQATKLQGLFDQYIDEVNSLVNDINEINIDRQLASGLHDELMAHRIKFSLKSYRLAKVF